MRKISGYHIDGDKMIATSFDMETGIKEHEVTNMFDDDGDETDDPSTAVAIVVKLADDEWQTVDIRGWITLQGN